MADEAAESVRVLPGDSASAAPARTLSGVDIVAIVAGTVIGAFIFRAPSMVAGNVSGVGPYIALWVVGGLVSLIGALCYAELATTYPNAGGEYHYLTRAFGGPTGFLFAWARLSVIQTGSIALQAFIVGDYASAIFRIGGDYSPSIYAIAVIAAFTALNVAGVQQGKWTQKVLTTFEVLGLFLVIAAGAVAVARFGPSTPPAPDASSSGGGGLGMAMVFVLLAYGGWNESSYLSAEVKGGRRTIVWGLMSAIGLVTLVYVLVNVAFVAGLGLPAMAKSGAVAADLLRRVAGDTGANVISLIIVIAALSTVNATIFTGARTNYALGRDVGLFGALGRWRSGAETPANALIVQGVISVALVLFGTATKRGLSTLVDYTTPVFWLFFLLVGISLFVLRHRDPETPRGFKVPLYPLTPILFCAACVYMLHASLDYTRLGALVGVAVLLAGAPLTLLASRSAQGQLAQQRT